MFAAGGKGKWTAGITDPGGNVREGDAQSNGETRSPSPAVPCVFWFPSSSRPLSLFLAGGWRILASPSLEVAEQGPKHGRIRSFVTARKRRKKNFLEHDTPRTEHQKPEHEEFTTFEAQPR